MNLYQLRYFAELAREQHYTNAAKRLNISQPSLSHAISQLEEELGIQLFEKIGRGTRLTEYGSEFLQCVKRSLSILDNGIEEMQRHARGEGLIAWAFSTSWGSNLFQAWRPVSCLGMRISRSILHSMQTGLRNFWKD